MNREWVDFRRVKGAVSLAEALRYYGVDWLRGRRPGQLEGRCPIHRGRRADAFQVNLSKNAFQCFACQAQGNVLDFVAAMEQCSVREAARLLEQRWSMAEPAQVLGAPAAAPPRRFQQEKGNWLGKNEGGNRRLSFTLRGIDSSHPYLAARGISLGTAARFGVGFYDGPGVMSGRMVIPIHDQRGELVGYAGRSVNGAVPKYRLPAGFQKSQVLFNLHRAAGLGERAVVVVEGYFDCLKVHQAGYPGVVGLMGLSLSESQERLLLERFRRVVLMLDGDHSGCRATERLATQLAGKCPVQVVQVPPGKQPDQLGRDEIAALLVAIKDGQ
jgi:DNA primase